tara:strand:+ start:66 stop:503 length:438 start_codon:yes stop_codon:yes gene_type:complete
MSEKKYNKVVLDTVDHFSDLILDWSDSEFGSFDKWVALLKNIMIYLTQHNSSMTEIEKTDFSVKIVVELCLILYKKHTDDETDTAKIDELKKGKLRIIVLIMDNPDILRTSVTMLNDILKKMDTDGDGKVSSKEFLAFICPCCCK